MYRDSAAGWQEYMSVHGDSKLNGMVESLCNLTIAQAPRDSRYGGGTWGPLIVHVHLAGRKIDGHKAAVLVSPSTMKIPKPCFSGMLRRSARTACRLRLEWR